MNAINLTHRCPVCERMVIKPAAILHGTWYCRSHAVAVPPELDELPLYNVIADCETCRRFPICRPWEWVRNGEQN